MPIIHVLTGLPASGKTSHARSLNALRFSLDDFRSMCGNGKDTWTNERETVTVGAMIAAMRVAILAGHSVSADNTHLVPRLPRMYRQEFSPLGVTFQIHDFTNVTIEECIERDSHRETGHVGENVIRKLAARHENATKDGWQLTDDWMNGDLVSNV